MPPSILHVVDSLGAGGMENGIVNVARSLASEGFTSHVLCLSHRGDFASRMPDPALVISLDKSGGFSRRWVALLRSHLRSLAPDVVHTHNLGPLIYAGLAKLSSLSRTPIVHGEHASLTPAELAPHRLLARRLLYRCCHRVHTVSAALGGELLSLGLPRPKLAVIPNGVDCARFSPPASRQEARAKLGLPLSPGDQLVGIVARFGPFKGHLTLLDAFDHLAPSDPALNLAIVGGEGPLRKQVHARYLRSPHRDRIHWAGFQPEPAHWLQALDLLALPSTNEGLSNVMLEAMACGTPVLSHPSCGAREVISAEGEGGFVADLSTPPKLAAELARVLGQASRPALEAAASRARDLVQQRFSLATMAQAYADLYRTALKSPH
jgi:glycosyltransferase involved in cell wall biosynthesis